MPLAHSRRAPDRSTVKAKLKNKFRQSISDYFYNCAATKKKGQYIALACLSAFLPIGSGYASPLVNVTFSGDNGQFASYYSEIASDLNYAAAGWEKLFVSGTASPLNLDIIFDNSPTAESSSLFVTPLYNIGSTWVYQQGAVDVVLDGAHNPSGPYDAAMHIGTSYLTNELWFDPNSANIDPVPVNNTDAESVFLHEFGHIFGFEGYRDPLTGAFWFPAESTFDTLVTISNGAPYFDGLNAEDVFGGPVPLTVGNIYHVGNPSGPGASLEGYPGDLMNGNVFYRGTRYDISALDAAIFADLGLTTNLPDVPNPGDVPSASQIPEPGAIGIFGAVLTGFWFARRWWRPGPSTAPTTATR